MPTWLARFSGDPASRSLAARWRTTVLGTIRWRTSNPSGGGCIGGDTFERIELRASELAIEQLEQTLSRFDPSTKRSRE
jgi:hypothetical protein